MDLRFTVEDAIAVGAGLAVLILLVFLLGFSPIISMGLGVAVFLGVRFMLKPKAAQEIQKDSLKADAHRSLKKTAMEIDHLKALVEELPRQKASQRRSILDICSAGEEMVIRMTQKGVRLSQAESIRSVFAQLNAILQTYTELVNGQVKGDPKKMEENVAIIETKILPSMQNAITAYRQTIDNPELLDLEVAINTLARTLNMQGLN